MRNSTGEEDDNINTQGCIENNESIKNKIEFI